jgi:hypothetical protein
MQYSANALETQPSSERGHLQVFTESVQNHRFGRARAPQTWHVGSGSSALQVFSSNFSVTFSSQGLPCAPVAGCLQALPLVHCRRWMLPWHSYTREAAKPARCKHRHRSGSERVSDARPQPAVTVRPSAGKWGAEAADHLMSVRRTCNTPSMLLVQQKWPSSPFVAASFSSAS